MNAHTHEYLNTHLHTYIETEISNFTTSSTSIVEYIAFTLHTHTHAHIPEHRLTDSFFERRRRISPLLFSTLGLLIYKTTYASWLPTHTKQCVCVCVCVNWRSWERRHGLEWCPSQVLFHCYSYFYWAGRGWGGVGGSETIHTGLNWWRRGSDATLQ